LQRKGKGGDGEQVKVCLAFFQGQHGRFFLQAVAPKTAQVSRAEKQLHNLTVSVSAKLWSFIGMKEGCKIPMTDLTKQRDPFYL
jgi:hypothetical protein